MTLTDSHEYKHKTTKKDLIIQIKLRNPGVSLKYIAEKEGISYSYVRNVWSKYKHKLVTKKGEPLTPLPFFVQSFGWYCDGLPSWYDICPLEPSVNRNRMKSLRTAYYAITFHKNGTILINDYHEDWRKHLRKWLSEWMHYDDRFLFFDYLAPKDQKHICFSAPGIPTNFKVSIKGIGTFTADKTPFPKGTMEYEFDPAFGKRLAGIEKALLGQTEIMSAFTEGMRQHMILIKALQEVAFDMRDTTKRAQRR